MHTAVDLTGKIQMLKKRAKIAMPSGPEEFRIRLRVEQNAWIFLMTKFTNRAWIQGITAAGWQRCTDYFLGSKVYLLKIPTDGTSFTPVQPPWAVLLHYEFACRQQAFRLVKDDGIPLHQALIDVTKDAELKEIHFTSPIALSGRIRKGGGKGDRAEKGGNKGDGAQKIIRKAKGGKGKKGKGGKGKGGKGKGSGKGGLLARTPDGREICYAFNSEGCTDSSCARAHICRIRGCLGSHPTTECPNAAANAGG